MSGRAARASKRRKFISFIALPHAMTLLADDSLKVCMTFAAMEKALADFNKMIDKSFLSMSTEQVKAMYAKKWDHAGGFDFVKPSHLSWSSLPANWPHVDPDSFVHPPAHSHEMDIMKAIDDKLIGSFFVGGIFIGQGKMHFGMPALRHDDPIVITDVAALRSDLQTHFGNTDHRL